MTPTERIDKEAFEGNLQGEMGGCYQYPNFSKDIDIGYQLTRQSFFYNSQLILVYVAHYNLRVVSFLLLFSLSIRVLAFKNLLKSQSYTFLIVIFVVCEVTEALVWKEYCHGTG